VGRNGIERHVIEQLDSKSASQQVSRITAVRVPQVASPAAADDPTVLPKDNGLRQPRGPSGFVLASRQIFKTDFRSGCMEHATHPLTIGQILDRIYHLMRANLRGFLAIAAVPMAAFAFVFGAIFVGMFLVSFRGHWPTHSAGPAALASPAVLASLTFVIFVIYLGFLMAFAIYQPAATFAALQADLGTATPFREAYAFAWGKIGRHIGLFFLRILIISGPIVGVVLLLAAVALIAAKFGGSSAQAAFLAIIPLLMLGYVGGMLYAAFMMIRLALAYPACVAQDLTAWAAIRRSLQLTRGAMRRIFLVALVIYAAVYAAMIVFEIVFGAVVAAIAFPMTFMHASGAAEIVGIVIVGVLFLVAFVLVMAVSSSAYAAAFAVLYRDQQMRIDPRPESGIAA
jgi:membrane-anchored glycerophosphoryl diester phosphodiesterase (GDPDase)